ncbi:MAG: serine hydrolase domain-containing protein, partial [Bacteroidota bacterium]
MKKLLLLLLQFPLLLSSQSTDLKSIDGASITIAPKDTLRYHLDLKKDEFAFMEFDQQGADIVIHVKNPEGKLLMEFDGGNGNQGLELVLIIPSKTGAYQLDVFPFEEQKKSGQFEFKINKIIKKAKDRAGQLNQLLSFWAGYELIPGFAVSIFTSDQVLFQKGYGYSNIKDKKPYTIESIQNIGSVSKTLIGISLMKAVEEGKLSLDDPINDYLPYEVINPYFPDEVITIRQLANHTSSIAEMDEYEMTYLLKEPFSYEKGEITKGEYKEMKYYEKNRPYEMDKFLHALLAKEGELYKKKNFLKQKPGEKYSYSNAAATLAAHIIELVYNMKYDEFTQEHIIQPLRMNDTGWSFETIEASKHSDLHFYNHKVLPKYTLITYPDGGLLTNVKDLTTYLQANMKGFEGKGGILKTASYQAMMKPSLSNSQQERKSRNYGVFWAHTGTHIGHNGGDPGIVCYTRFNPKTGVGRVFLMNMIPNTPLANEMFGAVWGLIGDYGEVMGREMKKKG